MTTASLRKTGGSLIVTVPPAFVRQNRLRPGSKVKVEVSGTVLKLLAQPKEVTLADIINSCSRREARKMRVAGWESMPPVGKETL